jgi:ribosomal protein S18 acetylase RimI-like enzyme
VSTQIWRAGVEDLDLLVPLFDAYRQFYKLPSNLTLCREYLQARLERDEAVVFLSLHARRIWVLYDLFVSPTARKGGTGRQLMNRARDHAVETGAASLVLSTARTNVIGQQLYESLGYVQDKEFLNYELFLT